MVDNISKNFRITYQDSSEFTYNASKIEVDTTEARLIDNVPNSTFYCTYTSSINANYADGSVTGTAFGGAAVSGGELDLTGGGIKGVEYPAIGNATQLTQISTIRFKYRPNYSGIPPSNYYFFSFANIPGNQNLLELRHSNSGGAIIIVIYDDSANVLLSSTFNVWLPVSGTQYEFGFNMDINTGATKLYIDNVQLGSTKTVTGTRSNVINNFIVGSDRTKSTSINAKFDDFVIYNTIEDLTTTYTLTELRYADDSPSIVLNNSFQDTDFIRFSTFTETVGAVSTGSIGYQLSNDNVNWYYWNGSAWVTAGVNTNTATEVNQYIKFFNLTEDKKFNVKLFLIGNGLQTVSIALNVISYFANTEPEKEYIDLQLLKNSDGIYDINIADNGDFELVDDFSTAVDMSILTDKRADESQNQIPEYRRGWWGNVANDVQDYEIGSLLWLLNQTRLTEDTKNDTKDFVLDSLQWFLDDGYLKNIQAEVSRTGVNEITLEITLIREDNKVDKRFYKLWENINN